MSSLMSAPWSMGQRLSSSFRRCGSAHHVTVSTNQQSAIKTAAIRQQQKQHFEHVSVLLQKNKTASNHAFLVQQTTPNKIDFFVCYTMFQSTVSSLTTTSGSQSAFSIASLIGRRPAADRRIDAKAGTVSMINDDDECCHNEKRVAVVKMSSDEARESPYCGQSFHVYYFIANWFVIGEIISSSNNNNNMCATS